MSNAKKLSYEMEEPLFLRRMRQAASGSAQPDRYIAPRNRAAARDDDEDAPAYVLEDGKAISREEFVRLGEPEEKEKEEVEEVGNIKREEKKETVTVVEVGRSTVAEVGVKKKKKKRKAARIVGADEEEEEEEEGGEKEAGENRENKAGAKKNAGKRRVKLSFGDEE